MRVRGLDHLVLTVADLERTIAFYVEALGMEAVTFGEGRRAVAFGEQKINLHRAGSEFEPKAAHPTPGSGDLCFVTASAVGEIVDRLAACGVPIEEGPVERAGARGSMTSVYVRDPDANLIEVATYDRG